MQFTFQKGTKFNGELNYVEADQALDFVIKDKALAELNKDETCLIIGDTLQLEFNRNNGELLYIWGYYPSEVWEMGHVAPPNSSPGLVRVELADAANKGEGLQTKLTDKKVKHDKETGWHHMAVTIPM